MLLDKHSKLTLLIGSLITLASCGGGGGSSSDTVADTVVVSNTNNSVDTSGDDDDTDVAVTVDNTYFIEPDDHEAEGDYSWDSNAETLIDLLGNSITVNGEGASAEGSIVTITAGGTYRLVGPLNDGQIFVNSTDSELVRLVLDGVNLSNSTTSPIYIESAEKTVIMLEDNTVNTVFDPLVYVFESAEEDEPNAAIFSKDDLSISGNGTLNIDARYNDGITSKDGLIIHSGNFTINAEDDGMRGKDYLIIRNGNITINAMGDGLKSDKEDADKGYISIEAGDLNITSTNGDAVQAESNIQISGGNFTLTSGGSSTALVGEDSSKGLKAKSNLFIEAGTFNIDSADDAIHSNNGITINNGDFSIATGDDGLHADLNLIINDGNISVSKSYEGIESTEITLNGGNISIVSSDDGVNIAGGVDGSGGGGFGSSNDNNNLYIKGGYTVVNASGDGIDSNGNITMSAGTVLVHGPTSNGNGALDYDGTFTISGGILVAAGSSQMAQAPSSASSQFSVGVTLGSTLQANQLIHIQDPQGSDLLTFAPLKSAQSIVFSAPTIESTVVYSMYTGGTSTGSNNGGLYTGGAYQPGTLLFNFSLSESGTATILN